MQLIKTKKLIFKKDSFKAFSLIEISIVLVVIGLVTGAVFKGKEIIENAKIKSVVNDLHQYDLAISNYLETYQAYPGDDPKANIHFSGTEAGNGNGQIEGKEIDLFWQHLHRAGLIAFENSPVTKLGGNFTIISNPHHDMPGNWIMISKNSGQGLFTPLQAQKMKKALENGVNITSASKGLLIIKDGKGAIGRCVVNDNLNLDSKTPDCVAYFKF